MTEEPLNDDQLNKMMFGSETKEGFKAGGPDGLAVVMVESMRSGFVLVQGMPMPCFRINGQGPVFAIGPGCDQTSPSRLRSANFHVNKLIIQLLKALNECEEYRG